MGSSSSSRLAGQLVQESSPSPKKLRDRHAREVSQVGRSLPHFDGQLGPGGMTSLPGSVGGTGAQLGSAQRA